MISKKQTVEDIQYLLKDGMRFGSVMYEKKIKKNLFGFEGDTLGETETWERVDRNESTIGGTQLLAKLLLGLSPQTSVGQGLVQISEVDASGLLNVLTTDGDSSGVSELFGVLFFTDGSGPDLATILPIKRHKRNWDMSKAIPYRKVDIGIENAPDLLSKYELRSNKDGYASYYIKKPESIEIKNTTVSGIDISGNPDTDLDTDEDVVTQVIMTVKIDKEDFAEYFALDEGDINLRRFSGAGICYGKKVKVPYNGVSYDDHRNIIVTNRYNTQTRPLGKYGDAEYRFVIYIL